MIGIIISLVEIETLHDHFQTILWRNGQKRVWKWSYNVSISTRVGFFIIILRFFKFENFFLHPNNENKICRGLSHISTLYTFKCNSQGSSSNCPHLTKLYNASRFKGVFPSSWKKARSLALKKSSAPSLPSDFHPIALLCFLSKVLK